MSMPPISIFSIDFKHTIPLRDPATDQALNDGPHWIKDTRNAPVAYVRGSPITLNATFLDIYSTEAELNGGLIGATWSGGGIDATAVMLDFDWASGLSQAVKFELSGLLPDTIGVNEYRLDWYVIYITLSSAGTIISSVKYAIGSTTHTIYTTGQAFTVVPDEGLLNWVYEPIMRWSCQWAAEQQDPKAICDAFIRKLPESGLSYGMGALSQTVRGMLLRGGGMCGEWYQFFQQLAHCQGIYVYRRDLTVVISDQGHDQLWNGAVATAGGVNRTVPAVDPYTFQVDNQRFPIGAEPVHVEAITACWYVFQGEACESVGVNPSTHAINFLEYAGWAYLYDPSFAAGPYLFARSVPRIGEFMSGKKLAHFKKSYLNERFPYLMGSIHNGSTFYKTDWDVTPPIYGLLVDIALISPHDITIGWSDNVPAAS